MFVILLFELDGWDVSDGFEYSSVVEPVDPLEGCELDVFEIAPRTAWVDDFGFEQSDDRLSQCVVIGIADAAHRWLDAGFGQAFGVSDGDILAATVAVVYEPVALWT